MKNKKYLILTSTIKKMSMRNDLLTDLADLAGQADEEFTITTEMQERVDKFMADLKTEMKKDIKKDIKKELKKTETKTEKKSTKKDANKPKNGYSTFGAVVRIELKNKNPTMTFVEINKEISRRWNEELSDEQKQKFKDDYAAQLKTYNESKSDESDDEKPKKKSKAKKDPNAIKKPLNSYMLFSKDHREEVKKTVTEVTEITKKLAEMWQKAGDDTKAKYKKMADVAKQEYDKKVSDSSDSENDQKKDEKRDESPKRGPSNYNIFTKKMKAETKMTSTEIIAAWKKMSAQEKAEYKENEVKTEVKKVDEKITKVDDKKITKVDDKKVDEKKPTKKVVQELDETIPAPPPKTEKKSKTTDSKKK